MNESKNILLRYPLELYYPSENELSNNDKIKIIDKVKDYILSNNQDNNKLSNIKNFNSFLENDKLYDYFYGVRSILDFLISGIEPEILFEQLFPNDEDEVIIFKNQFSDACDIILIREQVDWKKLNLEWYDFKKNNGYIKE